MSYREKTAWLMLLGFALTYVPYFAYVAAHSHAGDTTLNLHQLVDFAYVVVAQIVFLIVGHVALAASSPREARTPVDERDRAIERRSISAAYYVLISGMVLVGCVLPFTKSGWDIIEPALFMIVAAEMVHYGVAVASYRRQS